MDSDKWEKTRRYYDWLWREAEQFILAYFRSLKSEVVSADGKKQTEYQVPDLRQFSLAIGCLRKIFEARRLNLKDEKLEPTTQTNSLGSLHQEISRLLEQFKESDPNNHSPQA